MKKIALMMALAAMVGMASAQDVTYRQKLTQEINHVVVNSNCIVRMQRDTSNWVAYKSDQPAGAERLVVIEGNTLTTTQAAENKIIYVGTTVKDDTKLTFEVKDTSGVVLYQHKFYTHGLNLTQGDEAPFGKTQTKRTERNWMGLKKYGTGDRAFFDIDWGWAQWVGPDWLSKSGFNYRSLVNTRRSFQADWKLSYSLYMDNYFALGFGAMLQVGGYEFKAPNMTFKMLGNDVNLTELPSDNGMWESTWDNIGIALPLHFAFYPMGDHEKLRLQFELIPQLNFVERIERIHTFKGNGENVKEVYSRDLPTSQFQLKGRVSLYWDWLGMFVEEGITPMCNGMLLNGTEGIEPHHFSFGLTLSI